MPTSTICELFTRYGSDKSTDHSYGPVYEELLAPLRAAGRIAAVLEVGVLDGASLKAWRDYFPGAIVVGVDCDPKPDYGERIVCVRADSTDPSVLNSALAPLDLSLFDLIVDDGCHWLVEQIATWDNLWPRVRPGGLYFTEDIQDANTRGAFEQLGAMVYDLRGVKGRGDDVLAVWRK